MESHPEPTTGSPTGWPGLVERPARGPRGRSEDVTFVLIHGAMDRGAGMAHLARRLRDAPTLRYDRRGYGRARALGTGNLSRHVDDLIAIVGHRPVVLFGHSFGGLVALGATAAGRLDVRGLVTWEVPTPWIECWDRWSFHPGEDPGVVAERFMRSAIGDAAWDALPARVRSDRRAEGPALIADMDPILASGVPFDPAGIPVRCILGYGDVSSAPYGAGARWLGERLVDARVVSIGGATHGAPMTRADEVAELIRSVLGDPRDSNAGSEPDGAAV